MGYNLKLILRLLFLCAFACLCCWVLTFEQFWATKFLLLLIFAGLIAEITHFAGNPQLRIASFIEALPVSSDLPRFVLPAKDNAEIIFRRFVEVIQQIKTEQQAEYELLVAAANHLAVAMLVFDRSGNVKLCNKAALQLLQISRLANINEVARLNGELYDKILNVKTNGQTLVKTDLAGRHVKLSVRKSQTLFSEKIWSIVTIQDIQQEIAQEETELWQNIIRILTHEIINSTSPINMLTGSLETIAQKDYLTEEDRHNLKTGLQTIGKRSRGMTSFVESYRATTNIPQPVYASTNIYSLLHRIVLLFKNETDTKNIVITVSASENLIIQTDERLLEQILINLLRNAIEAADKSQTIIEICAYTNKINELLMEVRDNGCGISSENLGNVFLPFFSTKKHGTGVGLFISRKIAQSLKGTLTIRSESGLQTVFSLRIPESCQKV